MVSLCKVDTVCVNQDNIPERNQQVRLMSQIYSQAEAMIAWLGNDPAGSFKELQTTIVTVPPLDQVSKRLKLMSRVKWTKEHRLRAALRDVTCRPYWNRAWVVQEFLLGRKVLIWAGATTQVPVELLSQWFGTYESSFAFTCASLVWMKIFNIPKHELAVLIFMYQKVECSDPRDRIYALLGLASDTNVLGIEVDYSITMEKLCSNLRDALLRRSDVVDQGTQSNAPDVLEILQIQAQASDTHYKERTI